MGYRFLMTLEGAADVFCRSFAFTRSLVHPFEFVRVGDLRVMRDATPRKQGRRQEIVIYGLDPEEALRQIADYDPPRHFICVMASTMEAALPHKEAYKAAGYRMLGSEFVFVHEFDSSIPEADLIARRVTTMDEADRVGKAAGSRQILAEDLGGSCNRLYAVWEGDEPMGWVRSIHLEQDSAWPSNLYVRAEYRRRGVGKALMCKLLADDLLAGVKQSVLISSHTGAKLYPQLGYKLIGIQLVAVKRDDS